jgi:ubiquinone/menaquinone biosynthesis C-methylase UbiE
MSTYVLMRILESTTSRYDLGIRLLTLGGADRAYDRLTQQIASGQRVLDIGCGTGALVIRAARRGARVKGIDVDPGMLEIAARRAREAGVAERIELCEMGVAELDREPAESFDAVTSGLCFSELGEDELRYTLRQIERVLRPKGLLLVADEVVPSRRLWRALHRTARAPLVAVTYVITQETTHAVADLPERIQAAGLLIDSVRTNRSGSFAEVVARKPERPT